MAEHVALAVPARIVGQLLVDEPRVTPGIVRPKAARSWRAARPGVKVLRHARTTSAAGMPDERHALIGNVGRLRHTIIERPTTGVSGYP